MLRLGPPRVRGSGEPSSSVPSRTGHEMVVELSTPGLHRLPETPSGAAGLRPRLRPRALIQGAPDLPLKRVVLDAVVGRHARVVSVQETRTRSFPGRSRPAAVAPRPRSTPPRRHRPAAARARPLTAAALGAPIRRPPLRVRLHRRQQEARPRAVPAPMRRRPGTPRLSRALTVKIAFVGEADSQETGYGSVGRRNPRVAPSRVVPAVFAHLHTTNRGLHAVSCRDPGFPPGRDAPCPLRLSASPQGVSVVPVHVEPPTRTFGPGSVLFFHACTRRPPPPPTPPRSPSPSSGPRGGSRWPVARLRLSPGPSDRPLSATLVSRPTASTRPACSSPPTCGSGTSSTGGWASTSPSGSTASIPRRLCSPASGSSSRAPPTPGPRGCTT